MNKYVCVCVCGKREGEGQIGSKSMCILKGGLCQLSASNCFFFLPGSEGTSRPALSSRPRSDVKTALVKMAPV